jgi:hypothetical protein
VVDASIATARKEADDDDIFGDVGEDMSPPPTVSLTVSRTVSLNVSPSVSLTFSLTVYLAASPSPSLSPCLPRCLSGTDWDASGNSEAKPTKAGALFDDMTEEELGPIQGPARPPRKAAQHEEQPMEGPARPLAMDPYAAPVWTGQVGCLSPSPSLEGGRGDLTLVCR